MRIRIQLIGETRKGLQERLDEAYKKKEVRLVRRIHALVAIAEGGKSVAEVSEWLGIGGQTVRDYVHGFIRQGLDSLTYRRPPGRPSKLTKAQRQEVEATIDAGPEAAGYPTGVWSAVLIADWIERRFNLIYHPHHLTNLLRQWGYSFQKARFVSDHLDAEARERWLNQTWPQILAQAQASGAMILFGDEASFAQWGSLGYTWSKRGQQPTVKTSGKRRAYKVFGFIDYFSGRLFACGQTERFTSATYQRFLLQVMDQTPHPLILIQDGARYHTSKEMQTFFALHSDRLTVFQLPTYSPDFNPIEYLWKKLKKRATHLRYFADFQALIDKVEEAITFFAATPDEITSLMGRYCASLGDDLAPDAGDLGPPNLLDAVLDDPFLALVTPDSPQSPSVHPLLSAA